MSSVCDVVSPLLISLCLQLCSSHSLLPGLKAFTLFQILQVHVLLVDQGRHLALPHPSHNSSKLHIQVQGFIQPESEGPTQALILVKSLLSFKTLKP